MVEVMLLIVLYAAFVFFQVNGQATDHGHALRRW
jgi:hypothetical protein